MKVKILGISLCAASPAWAEVCDKIRPNWSPLDGPVSAIQELMYFTTSPIGIGFGVLFALHLWFRTRLSFYLVLVACGFALLTETEIFWAPNHILAASYSEGCRGLPWLTLLVIVTGAICAVLWYVIGHDRRNAPD